MSGGNRNEVINEETKPRPGAPQTEGSSIMELKNGKVHFKQKTISFEKQSETLQEIVRFREMLLKRIQEQAPSLTEIPEEHRPVIAKLAHESDKTLAALVKHIRLELLPAQDDREESQSDSSPAKTVLSPGVLEMAIKSILQRNNYGLDAMDGLKPPAAVCIWRWEVRPQFWNWLPQSARDRAESRQEERVKAKKFLLALFEALPQDERLAIFSSKGTNKLSSNTIESAKSNDACQDGNILSLTLKTKQQEVENGDNAQASTSKVPKVSKAMDSGKALKERLKTEKKAAKVEKEKKEQDATKKSQNIMANFFSRAKKATSNETPKKGSDVQGAHPSYLVSDFGKTFKLFVLKKDATLAPVNWFLETKNPRSHSFIKEDNGVIVIDDEPSQLSSKIRTSVSMETNECDLRPLSPQSHLRSIISSLPPPLYPRHRRQSTEQLHLKTNNPFSVRDTISKLSEAEMIGDTSLVRSLLSQLSDRSLLPAKVLIFAEDNRPGYFGSWTRSSRIIGPRTPFAKDALVFDYGYDSGEEWEDERVGDADDVVDGSDEEDGDGEDVDSDLDSWLVDDDEEVGIPLDDFEQTPPLLPDAAPVQHRAKRKADEAEKKTGKKRKVVVPLVPFSKGPCWETSIGKCEDFFEPYRIQMFNDTPFPIDPFTFVSSFSEDQTETTRAPGDHTFAVPGLPNRLANSTNLDQMSSTSAIPVHKKPKPALGPKMAFPDAHLPFLLDKISTLQAASINFLVEAVHRELRDHKVKKNTIEAKIREVGEKCKERRFWVVKPGIQIPT